MISLLQGKKKRLRKKNDDYDNAIFAVHQTWILKSSFKSREHAQKKEHGPYFEFQFRDVCIQSKEHTNLSSNKYFALFYPLSLP